MIPRGGRSGLDCRLRSVAIVLGLLTLIVHSGTSRTSAQGFTDQSFVAQAAPAPAPVGSDNKGLSGVLDRAIEYAAQNLRVEKVLIQLGLDPTNVGWPKPSHQARTTSGGNASIAERSLDVAVP